MKEKKGNEIVSFQKESEYYFQKGSTYYQQKKEHKAVKFFIKALETKPEDITLYYRICFLLTEMKNAGEFNEQEIFEESKMLPEIHFLAGIYFCMQADIDQAEFHLEKYLKLNPKGTAAKEAEKLLDHIHDAILYQKNIDYVRLSYKYAGITDSVKRTLKQKFESPFVRVNMRESLYQLDDDLISNVIFLYGLLESDFRAERVLRYFIKSPFAKEKHIELSLLALKKMGAEEPYEILSDGQFKEVSVKEYMERKRDLDKMGYDWNEVLKYTLDNMKKSGRYHNKAYKQVKSLWAKFIRSVYPQVPEIKDKMTWSAGLEYSFLKIKKINVSSKHLALIYNVSDTEVTKKHNLITKHIKTCKNI